MKTSELTGPALDWAVAKCEGGDLINFDHQYAARCYRYSTDWSQGGPIIEREKIGTHCYGRWSACGANMPSSKACEGPTLLIAAMRCFVASKLGDEVDVPKELA